MHLAKNIDLEHGFVGGLLIGLASTTLMYSTGRIMGISGVLENSLIFRPHDDKRWCWSYIFGLVSAGAVVKVYYPVAFNDTARLTTGAIVLAGTVTGLGTRMGGGCTSGHGVCGLSRFSLRSFVAVLTFMCTGAVAAYVSRETSLREYFLLAAPEPEVFLESEPLRALIPSVVAIGTAIVTFSYNDWLAKLLGRGAHPHMGQDEHAASWSEHIMSFATGTLTGIALGISGMCNSDRVVNFLNFSSAEKGWDPSLMAVMGGAVLLNLATFNWMSKKEKAPILKKDCHKSLKNCLKMGMHEDNTKVDGRLVAGSALFGLAWGLGGICPGPGLVSLGGLSRTAMLFVPSLVGGIALHEIVLKGGLHLPPEKDSK